MAKIGRPKKYEFEAISYSFKIPKDIKESLQKKINVIAAEEGINAWELVKKAIEQYEKR